MMKFPSSNSSRSSFAVDHSAERRLSLCPHGRSAMICPQCKQSRLQSDKKPNTQKDAELGAFKLPNLINIEHLIYLFKKILKQILEFIENWMAKNRAVFDVQCYKTWGLGIYQLIKKSIPKKTIYTPKK